MKESALDFGTADVVAEQDALMEVELSKELAKLKPAVELAITYNRKDAVMVCWNAQRSIERIKKLHLWHYASDVKVVTKQNKKGEMVEECDEFEGIRPWLNRQGLYDVFLHRCRTVGRLSAAQVRGLTLQQAMDKVRSLPHAEQDASKAWKRRMKALKQMGIWLTEKLQTLKGADRKAKVEEAKLVLEAVAKLVK
jgi:hypothetical protein